MPSLSTFKAKRRPTSTRISDGNVRRDIDADSESPSTSVSPEKVSYSSRSAAGPVDLNPSSVILKLNSSGVTASVESDQPLT